MEYLNRLLLKGNEAVVYGALLAGCDAFYGYPITPASEVAHSSAALFPKLHRTFLQAESEISAINMVIGASAAGKRVMTGSSGLGISLKQEAVSYLAAFELPAVIVDIMRGGPGEANYLTTIYLENDDLERRNNLLQEKYRLIQEREQSAEEYMTDDAELVFVAYGISARIARTAVAELRKQGYKVGLLRPKMVFPFPERALNKIVRAGHVRNFLCVELSPGQMIEDVKLSIECRIPVHLAGRMGGNIPSVREICEKALALLKGGC